MNTVLDLIVCLLNFLVIVSCFAALNKADQLTEKGRVGITIIVITAVLSIVAIAV